MKATLIQTAQLLLTVFGVTFLAMGLWEKFKGGKK